MNKLTVSGLSEALPPFTEHEALVEANRCLFCFDAPCTHACPTHIDIPKFIKKISTDNLTGSARTILEANLLGATCSRVCPVEELCEGACVLGKDHKPIKIGRLQRFAMDHVSSRGIDVIRPAKPTGKKIAVVGAGPAGLSCAGELAKRGHAVKIFEKRPLPGGLSTYGIIVLREPMDVALAEVEMIKRLGVEIATDLEFGKNLQLETLQSSFDAVFLGVGLGASPSLGIPGEEHITDGLDYIAQSKLDASVLPVHQSVAVIGAGNTAIDCATIAKRLGSEHVIMIYRRTDREMTAYPHEYEFIKKEGVEFRFLTQPARVMNGGGSVTGIECLRMQLGSPDASGRPAPQPVPESEFTIPCQQIIKAIGQEKPALARQLGLATTKGYLQVDAELQTSIRGVYAGGDCVRARGSASTVMAVQDGKLAAAAIDRMLAGGKSNG